MKRIIKKKTLKPSHIRNLYKFIDIDIYRYYIMDVRIYYEITINTKVQVSNKNICILYAFC